jgi:hypothetical protein
VRQDQTELGQHGTIADAKRFAFSILINDADSAQTANLFLWNPSSSLEKADFTGLKKH